MTYQNITDLTQGTNIVEWGMIINIWGGGVPATMILSIIILLLFGIMRKAENSVDNSIIGASALGLLISTIAWIITFQGVHMVRGWLPVICGLFLGASTLMKVIRGFING